MKKQEFKQSLFQLFDADIDSMAYEEKVQYIEKLVYEIGEDYSVRVVTSDGLIQLQALRSGVLRMSAREFREEVLENDAEIEKILKKLREKK